MKIFLGGTCNESKWREELIPMLNVEWFNPVVEDWTPDCMAEEIRQRETCDVVLYAITPKMIGSYAIAEVVDDSNKRPSKTIFTLLRQDEDYKFNKEQWRSLNAIAEMVSKNGVSCFFTIKETAIEINWRAF